MTGLQDIPVRDESAPCPHANHGNAIPILHEVRHALTRLIAEDQETQIDLNAIPFGPGDEERLRALLGNGEVEALVSALGPTRIRETAIPGVWLVDYRNAEDERLALHLEIARTPAILRTHREDLATAIATLDARLDAVRSGAAPASGPDMQ